MLKAAFVQGRLTKDELDARVGQTFASRTYADLAALTAGARFMAEALSGQLPPRPVQRGHAAEGGQDRGPGDDLVLGGARRVVRARHLPEHGVIQCILSPLPVRRDQRGPADLHVTTLTTRA